MVLQNWGGSFWRVGFLSQKAVRAHFGELERGKLTPLEKIRPVDWAGTHELSAALEPQAGEGSSA